MGSSASMISDLSEEDKAMIITELKHKYENVQQGEKSDSALFTELQSAYNGVIDKVLERRISPMKPAAIVTSDEGGLNEGEMDVITKTSNDLLSNASGMLDSQSGQISSYLEKLKIDESKSPPPSNFRARRLTYASKNSDNMEPPSPAVGARRTSLYTSAERGVKQVKVAPYPSETLGTYSCHGIEPSANSEPGEDNVHDKINQDRGCVVHPFNNSAQETLLLVLDGHGNQGDRVSEFVMRQIVVSLEKSPELKVDPPKALSDAFVKTNAALMIPSGGLPMNHITSGTTVVAVYFRGREYWTAHVGDSRAVIAVDVGEEIPRAKALTRDHKPDDPDELKRITEWGGYVSPSPEPGITARVWLNPNFTQIGLAMSRSIGDYAVKSVGVIPEPEINRYEISDSDRFLILASDGVWEFIESQEAVEIVHLNLHKGAEAACQILIDTATERWAEEEGDYRDDITAIVCKLPLPENVCAFV